MELKRINFLNFDSLAKALSDKENAMVKGITNKEDESGEASAVVPKKEALDGKLPKNTLRLALVSACSDAKSQLRNHNLNHLFDALMKRYLLIMYFGSESTIHVGLKTCKSLTMLLLDFIELNIKN